MKNYNFVIRVLSLSGSESGYVVNLSSSTGSFSVAQIKAGLLKLAHFPIQDADLLVLLNGKRQEDLQMLTEDDIKQVVFSESQRVNLLQYGTDEYVTQIGYLYTTTVLEVKQELSDLLALPMQNIKLFPYHAHHTDQPLDDKEYLAKHINRNQISFETTANVALERLAVHDDQNRSMTQKDIHTLGYKLTINLLLLNKLAQTIVINIGNEEKISEIKVKIASQAKVLANQLSISNTYEEFKDDEKFISLCRSVDLQAENLHKNNFLVFIKKRVVLKNIQDNSETSQYFSMFTRLYEIKNNLANAQGKDPDALDFAIKKKSDQDYLFFEYGKPFDCIKNHDNTIYWKLHPIVHIGLLGGDQEKIVCRSPRSLQSVITQYCQKHNMQINAYAWVVNDIMLDKEEIEKSSISLESNVVVAVKMSNALQSRGESCLPS